MSLFSSIAAVAAFAAGAGVSTPALEQQPADSVIVSMTVDSSAHELIISAGPFDLPNMPPMDDHAMMDHGATHDTPIHRFTWPMEGWLRGFKIEVEDADGRPLPRDLMHHLILVNFSRRQLLYSAAERLMGAGTETADYSAPKTIGVPMSPGSELGLYVAWHNDSGRDLSGVRLKLRMIWTPANQVPAPANAMPLYMDVNLTVGGSNTYDVPPGRSEKSYEFTLPVAGRLLGVSGHMHDYGVAVRLEDTEANKVMTEVKSKRAADGTVTGMERRLFGVSGRGLKLKANHRYRVVGVYENPTGATLKNGAMAHMVGLFVPDDMSGWPAIDPSDPTYQRDLVSLQVRGRGAQDEHGAHGASHEDASHEDMDHSEHGAADSTQAAGAHEGHGAATAPAQAPAAPAAPAQAEKPHTHQHGASHSHTAAPDTTKKATPAKP